LTQNMSAHPIIAPKKLIEVALPLDAINKACAREKSLRHGHPSTLHLWWARRPLAAARAGLFAQLVNDPSWKYSDDDLKKNQIKGAITKKRNELFKLITELVQWENTTNENVLGRARKEIWDSWRETCEANKSHPDARELFDPNRLPPFHDPFAGGGTLPLEAQRLGLQCYATDLNPVAVLINKAMIEIPPKFAGLPPVGPIPPRVKQTKAEPVQDWSGAKGLAEDVRRYGAWMLEQAQLQIGQLYPKIAVTEQMTKDQPDLKRWLGKDLTVIAWLWARTVRSPNPAYSAIEVPLASSFVLSSKPGSEAFVEPIVDKSTYRFAVRAGVPPERASLGTKAGSRGADFICLLSRAPITAEYVRTEGQAGRIGARLMAIVAEGDRGRVYLPPTDEAERIANSARPTWRPETTFLKEALGFRIGNYGLANWADLFTSRQLVALTTFADLVQRAISRCLVDATARGVHGEETGLEQGGRGARAYAEAVGTYLAFALSKQADMSSSQCTWHSGASHLKIRNTFGRQALPMTWDYAEGNPFSDSSGNLSRQFELISEVIEQLPASTAGTATQADAQTQSVSQSKTVSTDPPYFDNIGYADLSDFFYVWLRRSLKPVFPSLFETLAVPKGEELVATPARHGGKKAAEEFFLHGMTQAMANVANQALVSNPITIYYAFKQADTKSDGGTFSTGWETFLRAVLDANLSVTGTWPMSTELGNRMRSADSNALASSVVLVCRPRVWGSQSIARKDFLRQLDRALPLALSDMTQDPEAAVAPVDLAQAAIGPGMAIFSKYEAVLEANGEAMSVHDALVHINKAIDNFFAQAEGDLDADTRFCIDWFQQRGFESGPFGEADVLARAKGTAVQGVQDTGVLSATKGKVRLLRVKEYPPKWAPQSDHRTPVWEACHQMCQTLSESEHEAGLLLARMPEKQDAIRQLAYRLYTICERQKWAEEARLYNELITSWPAIVEESHKAGHKGTQLDLLS
jgi:putative DNA methylase